MKLKHLAAFLMLFAIGCTAQPGTEATPTGDTGTPSAEPAEGTAAVEPETDTQLASTTVKFDVTGMS